MSNFRFGLLGPFQFAVEGRQVSIGSPKNRTLLAALLVEPGRLVPATELIEAIWGAEQPRDPRRALHVCLTRTRAALADAGAPPFIVSVGGAYRADVPGDSVDVAQFRARMDEAGAAAGSNPAAESDALTEALSLWRGEPLVDISSDHLHRRYVPHLTEQRLNAWERRIEGKLRAGQHAEVIGELTEITMRWPLRERGWAQLMRALQRGGRRADALDAYHALRRRLADELGVEPSRAVQTLYAEILDGDAPERGGTASAHVVPRQLPRGISGFAGRCTELDQLDLLLTEYEKASAAATVVVLTGMAGIGKTTLAAYWARRAADHFPDGQLWLNLRGYDLRDPAGTQQLVAYLLRALQVPAPEPPIDVESQAALYRSAMDGRRMLLVLDNAGDADQVMPLLPGDSRTFVLITSRNDLAGLVAAEGAQMVRLEPFTADEARQMLEPRLGPARLQAEPDAVTWIIEKCAGLPLALALIAARAVTQPHFPLSAIHRQLSEPSRPLDSFTNAVRSLDVRAVFSWSYRSLSAPAAELFRLLGLCPGVEISGVAAANLADRQEEDAHRRLDELSAAHLITEPVPGRYRVHDLLRAYARELTMVSDPPARQQAARQRWLSWLACTAYNARPLMQPVDVVVPPPDRSGPVEPLTFRDERAAREWFEAEREALLCAIDLAYRHHLDDLCWRLAHSTWPYLQLTDAWADIIRTHDLGLRAARRTGDTIGQGYMLLGAGAAYRSTGDPERAVETYSEALTVFQSSGDTQGIAAALNNLCAALRDAGSYEKSISSAKQAYALEVARDEPRNAAISMFQIGMTYTAAGHLEEAVAYISAGLELFRRLGHRRAEARGLNLSATAHLGLGRWPVAVDQYREAVEIYRDLGDRRYEAASLTALGDALHDARLVEEGRRAWTRALVLYEELGTSRVMDLRSRLAS